MEQNSEHLDVNEAIAIVKLDDGTMGWVASYGAHFSTIVYEESGGHQYQMIVPNEDFEIVGYIGIEREIDDEL